MKRLSRSFAQRNVVLPVRRAPLVRPGAMPALTTLAMVIGSVVSGGAQANPTGGNVVAGSATINNQGNGTLNINQSSGKAIINWKGFSIGANETVNFVQPGSKSVTLNRVVGNDPSAIFGKLNANGTVMLVNPNGVVFGKSARVDVGGLVATTANIRDEDFMAGRLKFNQASTNLNAMVVNEGQISIKDSGLAALVAPAVKNSGVIEAKLGKVALAGARTFTVDFQGDGLLSFDASSVVKDAPKDANGKAVGALVTNTGVIRADGGTVLMTARAVKDVVDNVINTDGIVSAKSVGTRNGKIVLSGGDAGTVNVAGTVDASGANAGEQGGKVVVTGQNVKVASGAVIDASGAAGGGEIALGSQGVAPADGSAAYSNKSATLSVAAGATLKADALNQGKGGNVTLWSTDSTAFAGTISARGGANGGDGGFAEVSAEKNISLTGSADLRAPKGNAGTLLIDPATLEITGDTTPSNTGNVVTRGWLEAQAGNGNLTLSATGQITIDAMSAINLQTQAGSTFTLQSTTSGGIRFVDSNTEITTQGGNIYLQALGVGSSLDSIGKLTSHGGNITLQASGNINLANAINASGGAVSVASTAGSIYNTGGANQSLAAASVKLDAEAANVGATGAALNTATSVLGISSGGDIVVANTGTLSSLAINSRHAQTGKVNTYDITSSGLTFAVTDGSSYALTSIQQPGLNLSFTGDRSITVGTVNVGAPGNGNGNLALTSTTGSITGTSGTMISAGNLTLQAATSIGSASQALISSAGNLTATATAGGINLFNLGQTNLGDLNAAGNVTVYSTADLYLAGAFNAGVQTVLTSATGNIDASANTLIRTGSLTLNGPNAGSIRALRTTASTVSGAVAGKLNVESNAATLTADNITSQAGDITINGAGVLLANNVSSGGGAVSLKGQAILVGGNINAGAGSVTLSSASVIENADTSNTALITGARVYLLAPVAANPTNGSAPTYTIGTAANQLRTAAGELTATAGSIYINQISGALKLDSLKAYQDITVQAASGVTVNQVDAGSGRLYINAGGDILAALPGNLLAGERIELYAPQGTLGTGTGHLNTNTDTLTLTSGKDIYVDNSGKTLTALSISNTHQTAGTPNVLQITSSPYLSFNVTDDGSVYHVNDVYSSALSSFSFQGDQGMVLGNIRVGTQASFTATRGNITDDGDANTRVTAYYLTLAANQGYIGTSDDVIDTNASSLTLTTRGNLYVSSISDLNTLSVTALHKDSDDAYDLQVRAPSLLFKVLDSTAGHTLSDVSDTSSLNFSFTSDRDITVGSVNTSSSGSISLTSKNGSIKDDGDKSTALVANSVNLNAYGAIGAQGADHLDIITGNLGAQANHGGIYVQLPSPTGSSNYTGTITLSGIYAYDGNIVIDAVQGDLALGSTVYSPNGDITLTARNGSILNSNGYGMITAFGNDVTLSAAGSIGGADVAVESWQAPEQGRRSILFDGSKPVTITAHATSGDAWLSAIGTSDEVTLASVTAGKQVRYQQASGDTVVGTIQGGTQVSLTNAGGSIVDDGDTDTAITAPALVLTANGAIGAIGQVLTLAAPDVALSSGGDIAVHNTGNFSRLDITRTNGALASYDISGPNLTSFALTEDYGAYYLSNIASSTPFEFNFTGYNKAVRVGTIDAGATGTVRLTTNGNIVNDDEANPGSITASTVALAAGSGSIGSSTLDEDDLVVLQPLKLKGTSALTLSGSGDMYVDSDTALASLSIINTNASTVQHDLVVNAGNGAGAQSYAIHDFGTYLSLMTINGAGALNDFSLSAKKGLRVNALSANDSISLEVDAAANMQSTIVQSTGSIVAPKLTLTVFGQNGAAYIGDSINALAVSTSDLSIATNGGININNGGRALDSLALDFSDRKVNGSVVIPSYTFGGLGAGNSLAMTYSGTTLNVSGVLTGTDFSLASLGSITTGTISTGAGTGSISLTALGDTALGIDGAINRSSGSLTAATINLSATGKGGGIGNSSTLSTNTSDLSLASSGSVSLSNATTLDSLSLTALHDSSVTSQTNSYSISSSGLTFSFTDNGPNSVAGMTVNSISAPNDLHLALTTDRTLTLGHIQTGANGSVALTTPSTIYGTHTGSAGSAPGGADIITGDLTLNAQSVQGRYNEIPGQPLYISANTLSSDVDQTLWVSNDKTLTLLNNSAGTSANVVVTSGSILQSGSGRFVTPILALSATQGSIGANGNAVLTDTRQLTASSGGDLVLANTSDLYRLDLTNTHAAGQGTNLVQVTAKGLALDVTDNGTSYVMSTVTDSSGLDFRFSGDKEILVGTLDTGPAQSIELYSTRSIRNATADAHLTAGQITLSAGLNLGGTVAGTAINTNTRDLSLISWGDINVVNDVDLSSLSVTSTSPMGPPPTMLSIIAPELTFNVWDNLDSYVLEQVSDNTGLNFSFKSQRSQEVGSIDVLPTGTVSLSTAGDITAGNAGGGANIVAGEVTLYTFGANGNIGASGNALTLSTPQLNVDNSGDVYVTDTKHLDALSIDARGTSARVYEIDWAARDSGHPVNFGVTDDGSTMVVNNITDTGGVNLSLSSDRGIQVGTINVGLDNVSLSALNSALTGDGDSSTKIDAAGLTLSGDTSVGAIGNNIDTNVNTLSAYSRDGGVSVGLNSNTTITSFGAHGDSSLTNNSGDISLGTIDVDNHTFTMDNQGGSILSGTINNASAIDLTAAGSIGNVSAILVTSNSQATTTVTLHAAANGNGADGSIALTGNYGLIATTVSADGDITLISGNGGSGSSDLAVGAISSANGDVTLTAQRGSILGTSTSNSVSGDSVTLTAAGTGASIGAGGTALNVATDTLAINNSGSFNVADSMDLAKLSIDRTAGATTGSAGTMSLTASGLTFVASDNGTSTLTTVADTSGLDFSYTTRGGISVGTINAGNHAVALTAGQGNSGAASIVASSGSSSITAHDLTLTTNASAGSTIGTNAQALNTQVSDLTSTSGGGTWIAQTGTINLDNVNAGGALSVAATGGDILVGQVKNGANANLTLSAADGSILSNGGSITTSGTGAISLTAANGIGLDTAALQISAASKTVSASVTGTGSLYLDVLDSLTGGLTSSVSNGSTNVTSAGAIKLTSVNSLTDAVGNDIKVNAASGNVTLGTVHAGSKNTEVALTAQDGAIVSTGVSSIEGYRVTLNASGDIGSSLLGRIVVGSPRVEANSSNGSVYLDAKAGTILSFVTGNTINVVAEANLQIANAVASNSIVVASTGVNSVLVGGNIDAGAGVVALSFDTLGSSIVDDGNAETRIIGGVVSMAASAGIGGAAPGDAKTVQTTTSVLTVTSASGNIYIDDNNAAGVALQTIVAGNGAIGISTAGDTFAYNVQAQTANASNTISIASANGEVKVGTINAGNGAGDVTLAAAGDIYGTSGSLVTGNEFNAHAGGDVGSLATALNTKVSALGDLTTQTGGVIAINNSGTSALSVGTNTNPGAGGTLSIKTLGDMDASSGIVSGLQTLLLSSGGTLTLPGAGLNVVGSATLQGTTDVVAGGAAPRTLDVTADSLTFSSGSAGGNTTLATHVATLDARLTNTSGSANLMVENTGDLDATLRTSNGDIGVISTGDLTATSVQAAGNIDLSASGKVDAVSVTATGAERTIVVTSDTGDIGIGTINAGSTDGQIELTATAGKIANLGSGNSLTAYGLNLTARDGIGSVNSPLNIAVTEVTGSVTGTGGLYLSGGNALTLNDLTTHNGDIGITTTGDLTVNANKDLIAGNGGHVDLTSTGGDVWINKDIVATDMGSLSVTGNEITAGNVTTDGAQVYNGDVQLVGNLKGGSIEVQGNLGLNGAAVFAGLRTLTATDGNIRVDGMIDGGGLVATLDAGTGSVTLGGNASNLFALTVTGEGNSIAGVTTLREQTYNGATTLRGNYETTDAAFTVNGDAMLGSNVSVDTVANGGTVGGAVSFGGRLTSADGYSYGLQVDAGTADVTFDGVVGQQAVMLFSLPVRGDTGARLGALRVNTAGATTFNDKVYASSVYTDDPGTLALNGSLVDTTGNQYFGELAVLGTNVTLKGGTVTLNKGADASMAGGQSLKIDGAAKLLDAVGAGKALAALTVTGPATIYTPTINTTGAQSYQGDVTLGADVDLTTTGGGVSFGGKVDGAHDLTIAAQGGNVSFGGAVGGNAALTSLTVNTTGAVALNGGSVSTTDEQNYNGHVTLGANTVLTGDEVLLNNGADGAHALTIVGRGIITGAVGAQQALTSLTVAGDTVLYQGSIATTGAQDYQGRFLLRGDQQLSTLGGAVSFADSVSGNRNLSIAAHGGNVDFAAGVGVGGDVDPIKALTVDTFGTTHFGDRVRAASVTTQGKGTVVLDIGDVVTAGAQSYDSRVVLGQDTVLKGTQVALLNGGDGAHALTLDGNATLSGRFGDNQTLSSLTVKGTSVFTDSSIITAGDQQYLGAATLLRNQSLVSRAGDVLFGGTVDGTATASDGMTVQAGGNVTFSGTAGATMRLGDLSVTAGAATHFVGAITAASLTTGSSGTLALDAGLVDTTGNQRYGQHLVLSTDTTLTGANVALLAGVDAAQAGTQALHIAGNAAITGNVGVAAALRNLNIDGRTAMNAGSVRTVGDQAYGGAVALTGDRTLTSSTGSVVFGSTLDGAGSSNLAIDAAHNITAAGDVTGVAGLTLRAVDTVVFNGAVSAYRVQQLEAQSATYRGKLTATGADGIDLTGGSFTFGGDVSADAGAIRIAGTSPANAAGSVNFAAGSTVRAATSFTQGGAATLLLPANLIARDSVTLGTVGQIQGNSLAITTQGDITALGLYGPQARATLTLASPSLANPAGGKLTIGLNDADATHKLNVGVLTVPTAGSAQVYGSIGSRTGAVAAAFVTSPLAGSPWFMNDTPWGPNDIVQRVTASTAPIWIEPSKPGVDSLFRGTVSNNAYGPDPLGAYADPQVLRVSYAEITPGQTPGGLNNGLNAPAGDPAVLQTPGSTSTQDQDDEKSSS